MRLQRSGARRRFRAIAGSAFLALCVAVANPGAAFGQPAGRSGTAGAVGGMATGHTGAVILEVAALENAAAMLRVGSGQGGEAVRLAEWDGAHLPDPFFAQGRLHVAPPKMLHGLEKVEKPGLPVFDPGSGAWYASANGQLVRVEADGRLVVIADDIQGLDVDVRAAQGLAVSREGGERIVLHRFGAWGCSHTTVLTGEGFFYPRFSPDGSRILVVESRSEGGHMWITDLDGATWDVGQGYGASWLPDSSGIVFARTTNDRVRITSGELWRLDLAVGREVRLTDTAAYAETEPVVTPDGAHVVFVDGLTGAVMMTRLPASGGEVTP